MPVSRAGAVAAHPGLTSTPGDPDPPSTTGTFPWTMPTKAFMDASTKRVFAHYFNFFPLSQNDTTPDYYENAFLWPATEGGKYANVGGYFRDRPIVLSRPRGSNYLLLDMQDEVTWASARGIDGWTFDMLSLGTGNDAYLWDRQLVMLTAMANAVPSFRMIPMVDCFALGINSSTDPALLASRLSTLNTYSNVERRSGKMVVSAFFNTDAGPSWWQGLQNYCLANHGFTFEFIPCGLTVNFGYNTFAFGQSMWGGRNTNFIGASTGAAVKAAGKMWMEPVAIQDYRAHQGMYDEAGNTDVLRKSWEVARQVGDWAQIVTWSDYSEHTQVAPTRDNGYFMLDLQAYFIAWFKTGIQPTINSDALYITHRKHALSAPTPSQPNRANLRPGSTAGRDTVECLSFLTTQRSVNLIAGGATTNYTAPAGMYAKTIPLVPGTVSANISGGPSVTSDFTVTATPTIQDLYYRFKGSWT